MTAKKIIYTCRECNSPDLYIKKYVAVNRKNRVLDRDIKPGEYWCEKCKKVVGDPPQTERGKILYTEEKAYAKMKGKLLASGLENKYAVVFGEILVGTFVDLEEAYTEGMKIVGTSPFLVRKIKKIDPTYRI